ncbi:MAG: hypothetical protein IKS98_08210 [Lachnospiraceae bacterium]|nr:hypothetical protein [Lachnospiraceae bacterium]
MTNTEARKIDYDECTVKCAKSREECENTCVGTCRKNLEMEDVLRNGLEQIETEESADYMAELLMDDTNTTWKMYERLVGVWLNGSKEYRDGLNDAVILITGWSLDTITKNMLERQNEA